MWIFTTKGFVSIVQERDDNKKLHVRSRVYEDLLEFANAVKQVSSSKEDINIVRTDYGDYLYRFSAPREDVTNAVASFVNNINYHNFKASVEDHSVVRSDAYFHVWSTMNDLQKVKDELSGC